MPRHISKGKQGFTLIELVVVMVIMAILAAASVPTLSGFVSQGKESLALSECQAAMRATQAQADILALSGKLGDLSTSAMYTTIKQNSELPGELTSVDRPGSNGVVTHLFYLASNGLLVEYDAGRDPKYKIVDSGHDPTPPTPDNTDPSLAALAANAKEMTIALSKASGSMDPSRESVLSALTNSGVTFPRVTDEQLRGTQFEGKELYWKPYYVYSRTEPYIVFFAGASSTGYDGWSAWLLWIDGAIYQPSGTANAIGVADLHNSTKKPTAITDPKKINQAVIDWATTNKADQKFVLVQKPA